MTGPAVRGYWVTSALAFIGLHYSREASERLLAGLPRELRSFATRLGPADWCPRSHHTDLLKAIASANRIEARAYDDLLSYGQYVGTEAAQGFLRPFMLVVSLRLFAKKLPTLWARDHRGDGRLEVDIAQLDEARLPLRFSGMHGYDHVGVATLGWIKGLMSRFDRQGLRLEQSGWSLAQGAPDEMTCEVTWQ